MVAEVEVVLAEELGEVVEQHQQHPQSAFVQQPHGVRQLRVAQEGLQEPQLNQDELQVGAPAAVGGGRQQLGHEAPVREQLEPGEGEAGCPQRAGGVEEGGHGLQGRADERARKLSPTIHGMMRALAAEAEHASWRPAPAALSTAAQRPPAAAPPHSSSCHPAQPEGPRACRFCMPASSAGSAGASSATKPTAMRK